MGSVTFELTATGASGTVYRLRSATFMVAGPENKTIASPTDPADTLANITTQLRPGSYQVTLAPGWQMWRIPTTGAPVAVAATLISQATAAFMIVSSQDAKVFYQFNVPGDALVPGTLTIGITITEDGGAGAAAGTAGTTGVAGAGGAAGAAGAAGAGGTSATGPAGAGGTGGRAGAGGVAGAAGAAGAGGTGGAAGNGGAAGTAGATACGNSVVNPGEQCDSAAAFANNTCDHTTCQTIPTLCGNHLVQPGEQCDDGPSGSPTCSTSCTTISAVSMCLACETQGTTAGVCIGTKLGTNPTVGCAALSTADARTKCATLLACLQTHPNCSNTANASPASTDPTACFCGALDAAACSGAQANTIAGPCAATYFALYGDVSNANRDNILGDFFNKALPVGMANNTYACDVSNNCQSKCP